MLSKLRHFTLFSTLKSVYYAIFESHLKYASIVWGQIGNTACDRIISLQNNAIRILKFSAPRTSSNRLFRRLKILNFRMQVNLQNCLLVHSYKLDIIPAPFKTMFNIQNTIHNYNTRNSSLRLAQPKVRTKKYGLNSIKYQCIYTWNKMITANIIRNEDWPLSKNQLKKIILVSYLNY